MKRTKCLMRITEMNLRNALTEKDSGWVNIPQLSLNQTRLPLLHTHIFSLIPLHPNSGKKRKRSGLDSLQFEKKPPTVTVSQQVGCQDQTQKGVF